MEHVAVKGCECLDLFVEVGRAWRPSPVLLFESKLYRACSTSHVWMAPGDIFQDCASARDFVRIFVIWSKETSSPTQIHENLSHHMNVGRPTALPQMYVRTCQSQKMKAQTCISMLTKRERKLTEGYGARRDQRVRVPRFVRRGRQGRAALTGMFNQR